jgi:hypothetical protein
MQIPLHRFEPLPTRFSDPPHRPSRAWPACMPFFSSGAHLWFFCEFPRLAKTCIVVWKEELFGRPRARAEACKRGGKSSSGMHPTIWHLASGWNSVLVGGSFAGTLTKHLHTTLRTERWMLWVSLGKQSSRMCNVSSKRVIHALHH